MTFREAVRHRAFLAAVASNFSVGWAIYGVRPALVPLFVVAVLHRELPLAGLALTVFAIGNVALLTFTGRLADTLGRKPLAVGGLITLTVGTVGIGLSHTVTMFMIAAAVDA